MPTWYVRPTGDDAHDGTGPDDPHALQTVAAACALPSIAAGDTIDVFGSIAEAQAIIPAGVTLNGTSSASTTINSSQIITGFGAIVSAGNGASIRNIKVLGTGSASSSQATLGFHAGATSPEPASTGVTVEDFISQAGSDGPYFRTTAATIAHWHFRRGTIISQFDGHINFAGVGLDVVYSNCTITCTGPSGVAGSNPIHGVTVVAGKVRFEQSTISVSGAEDVNYAAHVQNVNGRLDLYRCNLSSVAGATTAWDLYADGGIILAMGCKFDPAKVTAVNGGRVIVNNFMRFTRRIVGQMREAA
jgi:hypothetical protein